MGALISPHLCCTRKEWAAPLTAKALRRALLALRAFLGVRVAVASSVRLASEGF